MFSQTCEYALRAVAALANIPEASRTVDHLAQATKVPAGYLSKVMRSLVEAGIVQSQRGPHGGFRLLRDPKDLTMLEVINAVDPIRRIEKCPLDLPTHGVKLCPLHRRLDEAIATVEKAFKDTTLDELLHEPGSNTPLCDTRVELTASAAH